MASRFPTPTRSRRGRSQDHGDEEILADPLLDRIAWLMDNAIGIPGTRFRIGLDALLGLFPGAGDFLGALVQVGLMILAMTRYKVPKAVAARMAANVLLDMGFGAIPVVGDLFDAGFKASSRNVRLLREVTDQRRRGGGDEDLSVASKRYLIALGAGLGIALLLMLLGAIALVVWMVRWLAG
jgi:hypothetical protein